MRIISSKDIEKLAISPATCVEWVRESFLMKSASQLPPKISLHPRGNDFFNTMPCMLPDKYHCFGCKVVSRVKGNHPALKSEMMMFDTLTGEITALINCDWITARRTGAVAAIAINTLRRTGAQTYGFVGLGAMAQATLDCLFATNTDTPMVIKLKRYKDQAERIIDKYSDVKGVKFEIVDTMEDLVENTDVIVSAITDAEGLLIENTDLFKPGALLVPIHTRGFQNCDTVFDRIIADDRGHVCGFKYFNEFKEFAELSDVLSGKDPGRTSDNQRIIAYNIGLGLHDVVFGNKILEII